MKAIVDSISLNKELKKIASVINKNTILPILEAVKMEFDKTNLTITATDMQTTAVVKLKCESKSPFTIMVDFDKLSKICNEISAPLTIEKKAKGISIKSDEDDFSFANEYETEHFPNLPEDDFSTKFEVDDIFFHAIGSADTVKLADDLRANMCHACLDFQKTKMFAVGTDALILYRKELKIKSGLTKKVMIPGSVIKLMKPLGSADIYLGEKFIKIVSGEMTIIGRLPEEKYVDYSVILQDEILYNVTVNRNDLISKLRKMSITSDRGTNYCELAFSENELQIFSNDTDFGNSGASRLRISSSTEVQSVGVNSSQLLKIIGLFDSDEVEFAIQAHNRSIFIRPAKDESTICLLQPLLLLNISSKN